MELRTVARVRVGQGHLRVRFCELQHVHALRELTIAPTTTIVVAAATTTVAAAAAAAAAAATVVAASTAASLGTSL